MINLEGISKYFGRTVALDTVSLTIPQGSIYGIIGVSGAGKSTLLRCINLLEKPDIGRVFISNEEITHAHGEQLQQIRRKSGMIFQHFNLLKNRTVYDNIALPLEIRHTSRHAIRSAVMPLLELTGLLDKEKNYPAQLSGGQKQRVAIARALVNRPDILLCDEATSALDPNTTRSILKLLDDINKQFNITIVLITHEMEVVRSICHEIAVMEAGSVVEQGATESIFLNPKHPLTKQFIQGVFHDTKPEQESKKIPSQKTILHLAFQENLAESPIITQMARHFNIDLNILHGNIEMVAGKNWGFLRVQYQGPTHTLPDVIRYLEAQSISVEVKNL